MASKEELMANARHWVDQAQSNGLKREGIGCAFVFFNLDGDSASVCVSTVPRAKLRAELTDILRKLNESEKIIIEA